MINWQEKGTLIYGLTNESVKNYDKVVAFDMDGTLIKVKSGNKFPTNSSDWILWDQQKVAEKIKEYDTKGYGIVIVTNQHGIGLGQVKKGEITDKIEQIHKALSSIELQVYIATGDDVYRKPSRGIWDMFLKINKIEDIETCKSNSIFVGDAAGRKKTKTSKADHSDFDYKFALNVGLEFQTPEQFFLGQKQELPEFEFKPMDYKDNSVLMKEGEKEIDIENIKIIFDGDQEMILMVGCPGSGKSTFTKNHLKNYNRINRDTLKTMNKCLDAAERYMKNGKNVVIDNQNHTIEHRQQFIKLAQKYKYNIKVVEMKVDKQMAMHMDNQRKINLHRQHMSKRVGKIPIHSYFKNYQSIQLTEGINQIHQVNFVGVFDNEDDKQTFYSF